MTDEKKIPEAKLRELVRAWRGFIPTPDNDYASGKFDGYQEAAYDLEALLRDTRRG